ncbi:MAG: TRAP transporter small permease [Burkholderiales bacterium]|nr:MAG: TRAP transporter small permease [Burkholderiales bacterium]
MRKFLNALYDGAAALAALFMVLMLIMVLLSILGRELGFHVRGTDAYAGYFMAAAGFLALAHTLKKGEHIRVTLLVSKLKGLPQKALEVWALFVSTALACVAAFYSGKLAWQSYKFNDMSTGNDATPLWIPQLSMAVGTLVLAIAFLDEFVMELRGKRVQATSSESLHNE